MGTQWTVLGLSLLMGKRELLATSWAALKQNLKLGGQGRRLAHRKRRKGCLMVAELGQACPAAREATPRQRGVRLEARASPRLPPTLGRGNRAGFGAGRRAGRLQRPRALSASGGPGSARGGARPEAPGPRPRGSGPPPRAPASPPPRAPATRPTRGRRPPRAPEPLAHGRARRRLPTFARQRRCRAGRAGRAGGRGQGGARGGRGNGGPGRGPEGLAPDPPASSRRPASGARPGPGAGLVAGSVRRALAREPHWTEGFSHRIAFTAPDSNNPQTGIISSLCQNGKLKTKPVAQGLEAARWYSRLGTETQRQSGVLCPLLFGH